MTSGKPMSCNGSTLAQNARDVDSIPALSTIFPIFISPQHYQYRTLNQVVAHINFVSPCFDSAEGVNSRPSVLEASALTDSAMPSSSSVQLIYLYRWRYNSDVGTRGSGVLLRYFKEGTASPHYFKQIQTCFPSH